jgi:MoxR-like ATPase
MSHFLDKIMMKNEAYEFTLGDAHLALNVLRDQIRHLSPSASANGGPGIIGLDDLIDRVIEAIVLGQHCILEGPPGLAKTLVCKAAARMLGLNYRRIQFTPDMMPSDVIGRQVLETAESGGTAINWKRGPIFANVVLADEINRASPKVQSATLEACEEGTATTMYRETEAIRPEKEAKWLRPELFGDRMDAPRFFGEAPIDPLGTRGQEFVVFSTMNPIEQEGVYPLAEAQLDRFLYKVLLVYPHGSDMGQVSRHAFWGKDAAPPFSTPQQPNPTLSELQKTLASLLGELEKDPRQGGISLRDAAATLAIIEPFIESLRILEPSVPSVVKAILTSAECAYGLMEKREKSTHLATLFFFTRLRGLLLSENSWLVPEAQDFRARMENLVEFTHARPIRSVDDQDGSDMSGLSHEDTAKQVELRAKLMAWRNGKDLTWRARAEKIIEVLRDPSYPDVLTGSSPRGLICLIRATFARALLARPPKDPEPIRPEWTDVKTVAHAVLRHRIRLSAGALAMGAKPDTVIERLLECFEK